MSDIFQLPCTGNLTAILCKKSNSEYELAWYLQLDLNLRKEQKKTHNYSVLIEHMLISPRTWLDLENIEFSGTDEGALYDGVHYPTSYLFLKFLKREKNTFKVNLDIKLEEEIYFNPLSKEGLLELSLKAYIIFIGLKIRENSIETPHANFTNPEWLKSLISKYISLDFLQGPFYPFPPPEPYSKNSYASFEPLLKLG